MKFQSHNYKKDGFDGQKAIVIPKSIIQKFCLSNPLINRGFITDIGYFPKAKYHFRKRLQGAEQHILIYCVEGRGEVTIKSIKYSVLSGDYFIIPAGIAHSYETDEHNPWTIYWCHFKGEQTDEIVQKIISKTGSFKYGVDFVEERIGLFNQLYTYLEKGYSYENLTYVNLLFLHFLSSFLFSEKFKSSFPEQTDDILEQSIFYMQKNITRVITLANLSAHANCSLSHYSSIFKKKTGFPPMEYFNHLKIQKACQYLQFTELRIKQIAYKLGIDDPYYFTRLFTKTMGYSPREYRQTRTVVK